MCGLASGAATLSASSDPRLPDAARPSEAPRPFAPPATAAMFKALRPVDASAARTVAGAAAGTDDCDRMVGDRGGKSCAAEPQQGFWRRLPGCGLGSSRIPASSVVATGKLWPRNNPARGFRSDMIASAWLRSRASSTSVKPLSCRQLGFRVLGKGTHLSGCRKVQASTATLWMRRVVASPGRLPPVPPSGRRISRSS